MNAKFTSGNWFSNFFRSSTLARFTQTGFIAAFAIFAGDRLVAPEFPDAFEKFAAFAQRLADRLDAERSGYSADSDGDAREASAADPAGFDFIHV